MKVERGGKAIVAVFVGAWFLTWAIAILAEVSIIAFVIGVAIFLILLVAWVFQVPKTAKALVATIVGLLFIVYAVTILARLDMMALVVAIPMVIALFVAWVFQKPDREESDSGVPFESVTD